MKNRLTLSFAAFAAVALLCTMLVACNKNSQSDTTSDRVSFALEEVYVGESADFAVQIDRGIKETNFIADGKTQDVKKFCALKLTPLKVQSAGKLTYSIVAGDKTYSGNIDSASVAGEYAVYVEGANEGTIASVTIGLGEGEKASTQLVEVQNILANKLTYKDVLNVTDKLFEERIAAENAESGHSREIYMKLVSGDRENWYWYVSYIGGGNDYWAALVNPETGAVISKK